MSVLASFKKLENLLFTEKNKTELDSLVRDSTITDVLMKIKRSWLTLIQKESKEENVREIAILCLFPLAGNDGGWTERHYRVNPRTWMRSSSYLESRRQAQKVQWFLNVWDPLYEPELLMTKIKPRTFTPRPQKDQPCLSLSQFLSFYTRLC